MNYFIDALNWAFSADHWSGNNSITQRLVEHLWFTLMIVAISSVVAIPTGIVIGHLRRGAGLIGALTGAARAIPTLGLLTLFGLWLGIGLKAPTLALIVLAIPSLLAGAYSGVGSISPDIPSAAQAIGMTPWQVITSVELPLALPVIMGGIRAATLQVIATATLAAYTADIGLGRFLFAGLKSRDYSEMLGSSLIVIALAVVLDTALGRAQKWAGARFGAH
ncbi:MULTISPECIES: ABC transporter permease [Corynebacterium]|uniref:ABC transporter permease n=1 Tax=Corynebacterium TaxID=1716 RepID=UPI00195DE358|nr:MULTISPECIES: ABC transporter permease subunit [Corynebacterium]MDN8624545.1 ABC transporter permease subunit [Corynebacterium kroppenstedtii]QRQ65204.1 ABC transporter permease subunit [Corynebacterium kroppenstedtii]